MVRSGPRKGWSGPRRSQKSPSASDKTKSGDGRVIRNTDWGEPTGVYICRLASYVCSRIFHFQQFSVHIVGWPQLNRGSRIPSFETRFLHPQLSPPLWVILYFDALLREGYDDWRARWHPAEFVSWKYLKSITESHSDMICIRERLRWNWQTYQVKP